MKAPILCLITMVSLPVSAQELPGRKPATWEFGLVGGALFGRPRATDYEALISRKTLRAWNTSVQGRNSISYGVIVRRITEKRWGWQGTLAADFGGYSEQTTIHYTADTTHVVEGIRRMNYYSLAIQPFVFLDRHRRWTIFAGGVMSYYRGAVQRWLFYINGAPSGQLYGFDRSDPDWPAYFSGGVSWNGHVGAWSIGTIAQAEYGMRDIVRDGDKVFKDNRFRVLLTVTPIFLKEKVR